MSQVFKAHNAKTKGICDAHGQDLDIYFEKSTVAVFIFIQLSYKVALEPQNSLISPSNETWY